LLYTKRCGGDIKHILAIFPFGCVHCYFDTHFSGNRLSTTEQPQTGPTEIVKQSCFSFSSCSHLFLSPLHYSPHRSVVASSLVHITRSYSPVSLPRPNQEFTAFWVIWTLITLLTRFSL